MATAQEFKDKIEDMKHKDRATALSKKYGLDMEKALKVGYSHKDIVDHLSQKEMNDQNYLELLLCPPKYLSANLPNNRWMKKMKPEERKVNVDKAMAEFQSVYSLFAQDALVYLLPPKKGLQDQTYISNGAVVLPHLYKTAVLSNFKAEGRPGEEDEVGKFLTMMNYKQTKCPLYFEGEAELKHLRDNIYFGGYGQRTEIKALEWIEKTFECQIIKIKENDPLRYHLDCQVFCINKDQVVLATDGLDPIVKKQIEKAADIIPVSKKDSQWSITNCVRVGSIIYNGTDISESKKEDEGYEEEKHKNDTLEKICRDAGLSLVMMNLAEFHKSGAALSCLCMRLTYVMYPK